MKKMYTKRNNNTEKSNQTTLYTSQDNTTAKNFEELPKIPKEQKTEHPIISCMETRKKFSTYNHHTFRPEIDGTM